mmetsp:Transcript_11163/g.997  ORF Transcript_11163/g.997 Transcript_11163/m.997 type:complete len:84 (-) Transcript_11163:682-933(-)
MHILYKQNIHYMYNIKGNILNKFSLLGNRNILLNIHNFLFYFLQYKLNINFHFQHSSYKGIYIFSIIMFLNLKKNYLNNYNLL